MTLTIVLDHDDKLIVLPNVGSNLVNVEDFPKRVYMNPNKFDLYRNIINKKTILNYDIITFKKNDDYCLSDILQKYTDIFNIIVILKNDIWHKYENDVLIPLTCEYSDISKLQRRI